MAQDTPVQTKSFEFALRILNLSRELENMSVIPISRQVLRSGTSIGANIEEAQAASSKKDFLFKMTIALKEARETNYWLRLISESDILEKSRLTP